jgi:hypothetical protein
MMTRRKRVHEGAFGGLRVVRQVLCVQAGADTWTAGRSVHRAIQELGGQGGRVRWRTDQNRFLTKPTHCSPSSEPSRGQRLQQQVRA